MVVRDHLGPNNPGRVPDLRLVPIFAGNDFPIFQKDIDPGCTGDLPGVRAGHPLAKTTFYEQTNRRLDGFVVACKRAGYVSVVRVVPYIRVLSIIEPEVQTAVVHKRQHIYLHWRSGWAIACYTVGIHPNTISYSCCHYSLGCSLGRLPIFALTVKSTNTYGTHVRAAGPPFAGPLSLSWPLLTTSYDERASVTLNTASSTMRN